MSAGDWTKERVDVLRTMRAQGHSCGVIARVLNEAAKQMLFTRNAVIGKAIRLGLPSVSRQFTHPRAAPKPRPKPAPAKAKPAAPKLKPAPPTRLRAPAKSDTAVRFIEAGPGQCQFFCDGEEGPLGYVCGAPVVRERWCDSCARIVWPLWGQKRKAA